MRLLPAALIAAIPVPGLAQGLDFSLGYLARETQPNTDNDLMRGTLGLRRGPTRIEFDLAVRNEDFSGEYPIDARGAVIRFGEQSWGVTYAGLRIGGSEADEVTGEALLGLELDAGPFTFRGLGGLQAITGPGTFDDGRNFGGLLIGETGWYVTDNIQFRAGLAMDDIDPLGTVAVEFAPFGGRLSVFTEATFGLPEYRGIDSYEDLRVGIRITQARGTLRGRHRATGVRAFLRPVDAQ